MLWDRSGSCLPVQWDAREKESVRLQVDGGRLPSAENVWGGSEMG